MEMKLSAIAIFVSALLLLVEGKGQRVLLQNVQALTLAHGQMTNARRSHAVPQLKCVGGTAAGQFVPQVVQCHNRGSDGYDVQWECKTDMDNAYRFGRVDVTCEGYDYPDDPYILRGSCGLEYTLDYTKEGHEQKKKQSHQYYGGNDHHNDNYYNSYKSKRKGSGMGNLMMLGIAAAIIYFIYTKCLAVNQHPDPSAPRGDAPPPYSRYDNQAPPPPGFKPEFTSSGHEYSGGPSYSSGCGNTGGNTGAYGSRTRTNNGSNNGGGFWTGMATGGLLGYLFGNNQGYGSYNRPHYAGPRHGWGNGWGNSWGNSFFGGNSHSGGSSSFFSGSGSSGRSSSTGTRTASGFGGTRRR